jgi:hypothetical protein
MRKRIPANGHVRFTPESGHVRRKLSCPLWATSGHFVVQSGCPLYLQEPTYIGAIGTSVSDPAPHALNVVFIGRSELMAHLGFLERNVDPISGGEDGDGRNKHWPCADP